MTTLLSKFATVGTSSKI